MKKKNSLQLSLIMQVQLALNMVN